MYPDSVTVGIGTLARRCYASMSGSGGLSDNEPRGGSFAKHPLSWAGRVPVGCTLFRQGRICIKDCGSDNGPVSRIVPWPRKVACEAQRAMLFAIQACMFCHEWHTVFLGLRPRPSNHRGRAWKPTPAIPPKLLKVAERPDSPNRHRTIPRSTADLIYDLWVAAAPVAAQPRRRMTGTGMGFRILPDAPSGNRPETPGGQRV